MSNTEATPITAADLAETTISGDDIMEVIRALEPVIEGLPRHLVVAACLALSVAAYREDLVEGGHVGDLIPHLTTLISTYQPGQMGDPPPGSAAN